MPKVLNKYIDKIGPDDVYIGRPTKWGNPFRIGQDGNREHVIWLYESWIRKNPAMIKAIKKELKGKNLVCFCAPRPCHGDILLRIANGN